MSSVKEKDFTGPGSEVLRSQLEIATIKPKFLGFWKYAAPIDVALIFVGLFFAIVQGVALPTFTLVSGALTNDFNSMLVGGAPTSDFMHSVSHNALYFVYIGIGIFGSGAISCAILANRGEVIASRFRKLYLASTLRQNIAYFDNLGAGEVTTRITNSTASIQEAISEKMGTILSGVATFVTAIVIAFSTQARLAGILLGGEVFIVLWMMLGSKFLIKNTQKADAAYTQGSSIVEESLSAIRTSVAFGLQERLAENFDVHLARSQGFAFKKGIYYAGMVSFLWAAIYYSYALAFWEGSRILVDGDISIGHIFVVVSSTLIGSFQFGNIAPEIQYIVKGLAALAEVNEAIERTPVIDSGVAGRKLQTVQGNIEFRNVVFRYPSRPDVLVLPNFSLSIDSGKTVALVGSSGCGKSTCVGLLERFYNQIDGHVLLDGVDIRELDVKWLRQQIGLVSQEPTLFSVSIYENIRFGLTGTAYEHADEVTQRELVVDACKQANAWDFIQALDEGLETNVGDRGFLLSGGQKQRIAIARAIVSNPKILLLDEATSALDTKSEGIVQNALERAQKGRTTISIAHRLSTIRKADKIVVMSQGEIIEQGTHQELLELKGTYFDLVEAQNVTQESGGSESSLEEHPEKLEHHADQERMNALERKETVNSMSGKSAFSLTSVSLSEPITSLVNVVGLLWRLNKNEQKYIIIGIVCAVFFGYGYPALAILVGECISHMIVPASEYGEMRSHVNLYTGMLFMVGCEQVIAGMIMFIVLSRASEALVRSVRISLFRQYLRMDMSFFDNKANTPGALTSTIAKDGKSIEGLGGATIGQIMQSLVILFGGMIQGIAFDWRLGLVAMACVPAMLGAGYTRYEILARFNERSRHVYEGSGSLAASYAAAVRTVQALTLEDTLCVTYDQVIDTQVSASVIPLTISGCIYGLSHSMAPWVIALIFWYGAKLLSEGKIKVLSFFVVFIGGVMGAQAAGAVFNHAPNMGKAKQASASVFRALSSQPLIDHTSTEGVHLDSSFSGNIEFKDVFFRYPTRKQVPVLNGLNLNVQKGEFIALVGPSGCGKSTCIQLVEHFYNVDRGQILFDGIDVDEINVASLRSQISLVQQEPLLYQGTVRQNILFGWGSDDTSVVTEDMLFDVCRRANIHDFILGLPDGYDTDIGAHGGLLSGGQKQRVAIARALIRNPKILLLDEATSALDSQSEKVVQAALDEAAKGRTTIAVAHRLSTIEKADRIFVFDKGRIIEEGTHEQLLKLRGAYAELVRLQNLDA